MADFAFTYETDPRTGVPGLRPVPGAVAGWTDREMQQLEDQLRFRYDGLVRDGAGTVTVKGKTLTVRKQTGDTSRQPTLEVRLPDATACNPPHGPAPAALDTGRSDWFTGWLDEIAPLVGADRLERAEAAMLVVVRDELRALAGAVPRPALAAVLLAAVVWLADQVSRANRPGSPHPYPYALSGLGRLLDADQPTPWGQLPAGLLAEPPPSWLGRFWSLFAGR